MGDAMEDISKEQLNAIRWLSDQDLIRLITETSVNGWRAGEEFLRLKMKEKAK
jgi:hypothetical protein